MTWLMEMTDDDKHYTVQMTWLMEMTDDDKHYTVQSSLLASAKPRFSFSEINAQNLGSPRSLADLKFPYGEQGQTPKFSFSETNGQNQGYLLRLI